MAILEHIAVFSFSSVYTVQLWQRCMIGTEIIHKVMTVVFLLELCLHNVELIQNYPDKIAHTVKHFKSSCIFFLFLMQCL